MWAVLSEEMEIRYLRQPGVVVHQLGICGTIPERQELRKNAR